MDKVISKLIIALGVELNLNNMKELILEGCGIKMAYKEREDEWVGDVSIHLFAGSCNMKSKIVVTGDIGTKGFDINDIDEAIEYFRSKVFCEKNLWYKHSETIMKLLNDDPDFDLDEDSFKTYNKERLKIIRNKNK